MREICGKLNLFVLDTGLLSLQANISVGKTQHSQVYN